MLYPITLGSIRAARPCEDGWVKLLKSLGYSDGRYDPDRLVTLGDIAHRNGVQDALWCARCLPEAAHRDLVRAILPAVERASAHTDDSRVHECVATIERWLDGEIVDLAASADAATWAARAAWAAWAARAAASAAAQAAASAEADEDEAARAAEREQQARDIIEVFGRAMAVEAAE